MWVATYSLQRCTFSPLYSKSSRISSGNAPSAATANAFVVRPCSTSGNELLEAAHMRAEAYYENQSYSRFTQSFIKQFAEQELRRLIADANSFRSNRSSPATCVTLVAIDSHGVCAGSLDLKTTCPPDMEPSQAPCCYVSNVVVSAKSRRLGVGRSLVEAAKRHAIQELGSSYVYAHVDAVNAAAESLYAGSGFEAVGIDGEALHGALRLGQRILLRCTLK